MNPNTPLPCIKSVSRRGQIEKVRVTGELGKSFNLTHYETATLFCCARQTSPDTSLLTLYSLPAAAALPVTRDQAVCELAVNALILQLITVPGSSLLS